MRKKSAAQHTDGMYADLQESHALSFSTCLPYGNALLVNVHPYHQVPSEGCGNLIECATNCFTHRPL